MTDMQAIADRVEIEALRAEFTDAATMRDYDRFASLFTADGRWCIPGADVDLRGRSEVRAGIERLQGFWEYFVQNPHAGVTFVDGETATGRAYVTEFGRLRDGTSHLNHAIYHDRYQRTPDGWRFRERVYEVRYVDSTPLAGAPPAATTAAHPG
jgi:uncharacterized protein (TIGR02246 family)